MVRTAYWVVDLSSYGSPGAAQIAAGQRAGGVAALRSGSEAFTATSGSGTITEATAVTGLTPDTSYQLSWVIHDDATGNYSVWGTATFVTEPDARAGASSAALQLAGTSAGGVALAGASARALALSSASAGQVLAAGASASSLQIAGSAAGVAQIAGASTRALVASGTSAAQVAVAAAPAQPLAVSGTSAGTSPAPAAGAAAYRSHSATTYASRTNTTIAAPSGIADGDQLILVFVRGNQGSAPATPTWPAGFSLVSMATGANPNTGADEFGYRVTYWLLAKTASAESGDYTVTHGSGASQGLLICASGGSGTLQATHGSGTGTTSTAPGLTTGAADSLVIFISQNWDLFGAASPPTGSTPTFVERLDASTSLLYYADGVLAAAGATGDKSHNNGNNANYSYPWQALLIEVRAGAALVGAGLVLQSDGTLMHAAVPAPGAAAVYLTAAGGLRAGTTPGAGDKRISLSGGNWVAG
mgnify:FL=1